MSKKITVLIWRPDGMNIFDLKIFSLDQVNIIIIIELMFIPPKGYFA